MSDPSAAAPAGRFTVTPERFRRLSYATLVSLALIVLTGVAVRVTDSGLGCPTWPKCFGHVYPPVTTHALIEFGNRALSGLVGVLCGVTLVAACLRKPFRRDLAWLGLSLPLGVVAQAVLGGFTVRYHLAPGFVMSHFLLSMVILIFAVALAWRATCEPGSRPRATDRVRVWSVRGLAVFEAITLFVGTAATAAGPHSGGTVGQQHIVHRLTFKGADTFKWVIQQHGAVAALFGVAVIGVWLLHRRRGATASELEPLVTLGILVAAQGLVGSVQYELHLPTEMVWVHGGLATASWLAVLWAVATAGKLAPRSARAGAPQSAPSDIASADSEGVPVVGAVGDSLSGAAH